MSRPEPENPLNDPDAQQAIEELRDAILQVDPAATFDAALGDDPDGVHLIASVSLDDLNVFWAAIGDLQFEIQVERGLPIFVIPVPQSAAPPVVTSKRHPARPR